jgi:hypothetical protein
MSCGDVLGTSAAKRQSAPRASSIVTFRALVSGGCAGELTSGGAALGRQLRRVVMRDWSAKTGNSSGWCYMRLGSSLAKNVT